MRRILVILILFLLVSSCGPIDIRWSQQCINNSDKPVYFIVDLCPQDNVITPGSDWEDAKPHDVAIFTVPEKGYWKKIMKDSIHFYVLDKEKIELQGKPITKKHVSLIKEEYNLGRITHTKDYPYGCTYPEELATPN